MRIVELTASQDFGYGLFFMESVRKHIDCFRISPADQAKESFPTSGQADSFTLGLLTDSDKLAGVVSFQRDGQTREKLRHKGLLFRMYVAAEHSGKGYGRILLEETIRRARLLRDIEQINLTVIATNSRAKQQYEKLGFRSFSLEKNAIKDGDTYYDEEQMVLFLNE
ncbi:GNAT family N-acetyltransferase [Spirosoma sp. KNUC1025]|uniref:GNAT family N-acetyltransferase n=1 Tax=Spirosoma sp. KNUC1025 TaxID=2894082 RepID=UPI00386C7F74|nr:GNAT family N-acetyltransferase [Spirosoma sp. KNUC1025]